VEQLHVEPLGVEPLGVEPLDVEPLDVPLGLPVDFSANGFALRFAIRMRLCRKFYLIVQLRKVIAAQIWQ